MPRKDKAPQREDQRVQALKVGWDRLLAQHGSIRATARAYGVNPRTIRRWFGHLNPSDRYQAGTPSRNASTKPTPYGLEVYRAIWDFHAQHGYVPTIREVAGLMGSAYYAAHQMLVRLARWELISLPRQRGLARAYRLLRDPQEL